MLVQVQHTSDHQLDGKWHTLEDYPDDAGSPDGDCANLREWGSVRARTFKQAYERPVRILFADGSHMTGLEYTSNLRDYDERQRKKLAAAARVRR